MSKKRGISQVSGLGRSQGLATGAAIAEGANNFMNTFMNARRAQYMAAAHAQQMQAVAQLRQMQAQKIMADLQDKTIDVSKINMIAKAQQGGLDVPSSVQKDVWGGFVNGIKSPQDAMIAHHLLDRITGGASNAGLGPDSSSGQANPNVKTLNPAEYKMATAMIQPNANMAMTGIKTQTQKDIEQMKAQHALELVDAQYSGKLDVMKQMGANQAQQAKIRGQWAVDRQRVANQGGLDIAGVRGDASMYSADARAAGTVGAAKVRAGATGAGKSQNDMAAKSILKQIEDTQKKINSAGDQKGLLPPDPVQVQKNKQDLQGTLNGLYDQYKQKTNVDLRVQPPQAAPTVPVAPAKPLMGPVQQAATPSAKPSVIPFDATQANQAPAGAYMNTPNKGWVTKQPDGTWVPAQDPNLGQ